MNRSFISLTKSSQDDDMVPDADTPESCIKFDQQIILTKDQFKLLKIISSTHDKLISEYIQKAIIEKMKNEIEFGDFCDILLDKLDAEFH